MLWLTKAKRPRKFKMLCGFNEHAVKLKMHKAALYRKKVKAKKKKRVGSVKICILLRLFVREGMRKYYELLRLPVYGLLYIIWK